MFQMASFHNEKSHLGKMIRKKELDSFSKRIKLIRNRKNLFRSQTVSCECLPRSNPSNRSASMKSKLLYIIGKFFSFEL